MSLRRGLIVGLVLCVAGLAVLAWHPWGKHTISPSSQSAQSQSVHGAPPDGPSIRRQAEAAFALLPMDKTGLREVWNIREILALASIRDADFAKDPRLAELLDQSAEFLCYRYGPNATAEQYVRWRKDNAYRWADRSYLESDWTVHEAWPFLVPNGVAFPGYDHLSEVFSEVFIPTLEIGKGRNRPVAMPTSKTGIIVAHDWLTRGNPDLPLLSGELNSASWHGLSAGTFCAFWQPPRSLEQLLLDEGTAEVVRVAIIFEFSDGSRRPFIQKWLWDPHAARWFLYALNEQHSDWGESTAGYY